MSNVINLKNVRKQKDRAKARQKADENAVRHGLSKSRKQAEKNSIKKLSDHLDNHRRDS